MKRFTLTRGAEVLAEGVVWTDGTGRVNPLEIGVPWNFSDIRDIATATTADVSIVWIDETHEAKPPVMVLGTLPKYTQTLIGETEHGDQVFAVEQEEKKGKLPSERAREIFASQGIAPGNMEEILAEHETIWRVLDEFIGKKAL